MQSLQVNTTVEIDDQKLYHLLVTAIEGGINYWVKQISIMNRNDPLILEKIVDSDLDEDDKQYLATSGIDGGFVHVIAYMMFQDNSVIIDWRDDDDDDVSGLGVVGRAHFAHALQFLASSNSRHWKDIVDDEFDSITVDAFFQIAAIGKITFG